MFEVSNSMFNNFFGSILLRKILSPLLTLSKNNCPVSIWIFILFLSSKVAQISDSKYLKNFIYFPLVLFALLYFETSHFLLQKKSNCTVVLPSFHSCKIFSILGSNTSFLILSSIFLCFNTWSASENKCYNFSEGLILSCFSITNSPNTLSDLLG